MIIRVTTLDQMIWFRRLENMTVQELLSRIKGTAEPNEKMKMGTAFHSILENPPDVIDTIEKDGFKFEFDCDATIKLPSVREIRGSKEYTVNGINITLSGGCDGVDSPVVYDHKLTFKPAPENYFDSFQWRSYLDIFNADKFIYYLYHAKQNKDGTISIVDVSSLSMYRYEGMVDDLIAGISDLLGFIEDHSPEMIN